MRSHLLSDAPFKSPDGHTSLLITLHTYSSVLYVLPRVFDYRTILQSFCLILFRFLGVM